MTIRSSAMLLTVLSPALLTACGGKLVAEQPFALADGKASLDWEVPMPQGKASLWLDYAMSTPSEVDLTDRGPEPVYNVVGTMSITTSGNTVYDGVLQLDDGQPCTTTTGSSATIGSSESCNPAGCTVTGRRLAMKLENLAEGSPLVIHAELPANGGGASIESLSLQLRAK